MAQPIWAPLTAFTGALVIIWWLTRSGLSMLALDHPNQRSLHQAPVPRTGGIGIHAGILLGWAMVTPSLPLVLWLALAILLTVSFLDDVRGVPVIGRLAAHLLAACALAASLLLADFGFIAVLIATLTIAWMANLYNFMDGSDGLAGGMTVFGFSCYGVMAWLAGNTVFALLNVSVAAASAAFLVFNFHPARVFMGDVGSVPLGFLAAAFGLIGWLHGDWPVWFGITVFSPFIVDASLTLLKRLLRGARVWQAHREHYYQRLVQSGWGHRKTALAEYALMLVCGGVAIAGTRLEAAAQAALAAGIGLAYAFLIFALEHKLPRVV